MPHAVVLLSGGLDSAVTLACATREGFSAHALSIDYGQRHRHELVAARDVARQLGAASHRVVSLDLRAVGGSALTSDLAVPKDRGVHDVSTREDATSIPITYVPARNLTFLSIALGYAETLGSMDLFAGVNAVDYSGYPDCRPEFVASFARTATLGSKAGVESLAAGGQGIRIHTPIIALTKAQIITMGHAMGVDFALTHSCYDPVVRADQSLACGHCDSCVIRREGFHTAQVKDPTRYV
jgi:7-cyano-7-deazaguanine synthase